MQIRHYREQDQAAVLQLWQACGLLRPWNNPGQDITRKLGLQPQGFVVGVVDQAVVASAMFGYEGHRGWVNYLAVAPAQQHKGYARQLMAWGEQWLLGQGCPKINLQVRADNASARVFYNKLGYQLDDVLSFGKRLIVDDPNHAS